MISSPARRTGTIGIEFHAEGIARFVGAGMQEIANRVLDADEVFGRLGRELEERLKNAPLLEDKLAHLQGFLKDRLARTRPVPGLVDHVARRLRLSHGALEIGALEKETGYSRRSGCPSAPEAGPAGEPGMRAVGIRRNRYLLAMKRPRPVAALRWLPAAVPRASAWRALPGLALALLFAGCGSDSSGDPVPEPLYPVPARLFADGAPAGNPAGGCLVPAEALPDTGAADRIVGDGTRASCTAEAFRSAVARGGRIAFDCGPDTLTIALDRPARIYNDSSDEVVIDGGGQVTLSGGGRSRILYMNTCDPELHWTTDHCQDQETPRLTIQNLTFADGNSESETEHDGGGAIWARGGRLKIVNCRFFGNRCARTGPDVGGGAVRVFSQSRSRPVHVVNSTFGAPGRGNVGSNGGALSSIGVNWSIWNSVFEDNEAIGNGGNPARSETPGGSGGAIYNDGNSMTLSVCGSELTGNRAAAFGAAIFFVSNNHDGLLRLVDSRIGGNLGGGWHVLPGVAMHEDTRREIVRSTLEN